MSFRCDHCRKVVTHSLSPVQLAKEQQVVQHRPAKPNHVVVQRHANGQIAKEEDWCDDCFNEGKYACN